MNKQPEALALRLADSLRNTLRWHELTDDECDAAAAELRRLHAENQALNDALQYSMGCHREMSELAVKQRARLDELELQGEQKPLTDEQEEVAFEEFWYEHTMETFPKDYDMSRFSIWGEKYKPDARKAWFARASIERAHGIK